MSSPTIPRGLSWFFPAHKNGNTSFFLATNLRPYSVIISRHFLTYPEEFLQPAERDLFVRERGPSGIVLLNWSWCQWHMQWSRTDNGLQVPQHKQTTTFLMLSTHRRLCSPSRQNTPAWARPWPARDNTAQHINQQKKLHGNHRGRWQRHSNTPTLPRPKE